MLIERMDNNFVKKKFSSFFFVEVLAMVQKNQNKERNKRGERFRFGFYYHNRVVLN